MLETGIIIWVCIAGYLSLKLGFISAVLDQNTAKKSEIDKRKLIITSIKTSICMFFIITIGLPIYIPYKLVKWIGKKINNKSKTEKICQKKN